MKKTKEKYRAKSTKQKKRLAKNTKRFDSCSESEN
ncbi:hypothetical protein D104_04505 [Marinomonas profundimaris]|uniref:Uncharacterized protein n=1 Tax=Marinomonas profundimaris TaxID=1208321 RepID=W1RWU0_9GAMM|nr:hypothetical protein D104_04505 [Marinomonas profundimaris]